MKLKKNDKDYQSDINDVFKLLSVIDRDNTVCNLKMKCSRNSERSEVTFVLILQRNSKVRFYEAEFITRFQSNDGKIIRVSAHTEPPLYSITFNR